MIDFTYIFLVLYISLLVLLVYKYSFFQSNILTKRSLIVLVLFKMFAGIFYIYINKYHIQGGDIFNYFNDANIIFEQLKVNPFNYFRLVFFANNVAIPSDLIIPINEMGFWTDTGSYMIVRFNALIRLISFNNIYINGVFAGFFSFIGSFLIAKVFEQNLKVNKIIIFSIFLSPSLLLWTSGIHKEFISVLALGLILYSFFKLIKRLNNLKYLFTFIIGISLFFFTRNYMLLALIPSLTSWFIHKVFHIRFRRAVYFNLLLFIAFMNYQKIPSYNKTGFEVIIEKRIQFENLKQGNTYIELDKIDANFISLMKNSPKALFNTIARPHFGEIKNIYLALSSFESFLVSILIILALLNFHKLNKKESNLVIFMFMYSIFLLLIIGWIVPNIGAIVRYRSLALIILIPTLLHVILRNKNYSIKN